MELLVAFKDRLLRVLIETNSTYKATSCKVQSIMLTGQTLTMNRAG